MRFGWAMLAGGSLAQSAAFSGSFLASSFLGSQTLSTPATCQYPGKEHQGLRKPLGSNILLK
jgi:hypothetical protein